MGKKIKYPLDDRWRKSKDEGGGEEKKLKAVQLILASYLLPIILFASDKHELLITNPFLACKIGVLAAPAQDH